MKSHRLGRTTGWTTTSALAVFLVLGTAACGDDDGGSDDGPYTLTFSGEGYDAHTGQTLAVNVFDVATGLSVATDQVVVQGGTFSFSWVDLLERDRSYRIDFYADLSGNGACDAPPLDHAWSVTVNGVTANHVVDQPHSTDFTDSCASFDPPQKFDLTFNGVSFDPHNGDDLYVALVRTSDDAVLDTDQVNLSGGQFSFTWTEILDDGQAYHLDFYADVDSSGDCGGADHIWREAIPAVSEDTTVEYTHGVDFEPLACDSF